MSAGSAMLLPLAAGAAILCASWALLLHLRLKRLQEAVREEAGARAPAPGAGDAGGAREGAGARHAGVAREGAGARHAALRPVGTGTDDAGGAGEGAAALDAGGAPDGAEADAAGRPPGASAGLLESESRFRSVVESLGEGLIINDWDGKVLWVNRRVTELTGYAPEELIGRPVVDVLVPEERREEIRAKMEGRRRGESEEHELELVRKDGTRVWTEVHGRPHRNASGEIVGSLSTLTDITVRRSVQEALRESEERYRALFEEDVAGNFITSVAGEIVACNQAFAHIFGFDSVEDAVGSPTRPLTIDPAAREEFLDLVREKRRLEYHEIELRHRDGTPLHVVENVNGIFDENGELTALQGHLIDITDRKRLEEQLHQSQKMEAVGRLAGGIAHDFNNLLTAITGYTDLLLIDPGATAEIREDLEKIRAAADRAATLTNQLLAFSRRQVLQPKVVNLSAVVEGMSELVERLIGEDIEFRTDLSDDVWHVKADPNQLEQVLMNLVVNARDAMPAGGELTVRTANVTLGEGRAARSLDLSPGDYSTMEVTDTGEGIPEGLADRIFEPFFTTKEAGKGTGLGLSMAYGLMKQSGGHIVAESAPGSGSTFRIYLPRVAEALTGADAPAPETERAPGGAETILLVEDEGIVRSLARRVLARRGYTILEAGDAKEALAHCREWEGPIHLLLSDVVMPEVDGKALAEELGALRPGLRVLFISGYSELDGGGGELRHAFLPKPFTPDELVDKVRATLDAPSAPSASEAVPGPV